MKVRTRIIDLDARRTEKDEELDTGSGVLQVAAGSYLITGLDGRETPVSAKLFPELYDLVDFDPQAKNPARWLDDVKDPELKAKIERLQTYVSRLESSVPAIVLQEAQDASESKKP